VLRIFSPLNIRRFRPGLNPRTWVLKTPFASTTLCALYFLWLSYHILPNVQKKFLILSVLLSWCNVFQINLFMLSSHLYLATYDLKVFPFNFPFLHNINKYGIFKDRSLLGSDVIHPGISLPTSQGFFLAPSSRFGNNLYLLTLEAT
jgi:hypothetical protein